MSARRTEIKQGSAVARTKLTFGEYLLVWLADVVDVTKAETTKVQYRWMASKRLIPKLGQIALGDLATVRNSRWVADLATTPTEGRHCLSQRSVEEAFRMLHMALQVAVRQRLLPYNPADGVALPKVERQPQREMWTPEQAQRILQVASQDAYEP